MICRNPRLPRPKKKQLPDPDLTTKDQEARNWARFIDDVQGIPLLSPHEETLYIEKAQAGDRRAAHHVCASNIRFIMKVAGRYVGQGLTLAELVQEGAMGMLRALKTFNIATGNRFNSYAVWWVRQAILNALGNTARPIRVSAQHEQAIRQLRFKPLKQVIGGSQIEDLPPDTPETRVKEKYLRSGLSAAYGVVSMTGTGEFGDPAPADFLASNSPPTDTSIIEHEQRQALREMLRPLPDSLRKVITLLFGLQSGEPMTLQQVGDVLGVSRERVRQLREEGIKKMRKVAQARGIEFPA